MSSPIISFRFIESDSKIANRILQAMVREYNKRLNIILGRVVGQIRLELPFFFEQSATYQALAGGKLEAEFGFPRDGKMRIDTIIQSIMNGIRIGYRHKVLGNRIVGSVTVGILKRDLSEIFSLPKDIIEVQNVSGTYPYPGIQLPWSEWILLRSNDIIISQHDIVWETRVQSRSGQAVMIKNNAKSWRVPPEHSGSSMNNFLTRLLDKDSKKITEMIYLIIDKELSR